MKLFFKWILLTLGSLLVVSILAAFILPAIYRDDIRIDLEKEIDQQVDADVTFSEVELHALRHFPNLTLSLNNLLIIGKNDFKSDTLAWVKSAHLEMNLWSLITKREIEIKSINLLDPEINVYVLKDGKVNYDIVKKGDSTSKKAHSKVNIAIDEITIERGNIFYSDWKKNIFVKAVDIEHEGSGDFLEDIFDYKTRTIVRHFSLNYGSIQYFFKKEVEVEMVLEMNLPESKFTFKENRIQVNHFIFSIDGFFQQVVDRYAMNLKFQAEETTFKNILSLVPGLYMKSFDDMETRGDLTFNGFLEGVYSASTNELPAFHLDINVKDAMVKIDSLPEAFNNIQFEMVVDNKERILDSTIIDLKQFHVDLGKHPVHGRLKIAGLHNPKVDADVFADVDVAALERLFPIKKFVLKGKANFELKAKGIYDRENSHFPPFHLNLKLADGYVRYDSFPRPISNIQFHLSAANETGDLNNTVIDFRQIHADVEDNTLHGFVKLKGFPDTEVDADLDADLDLEDIEKIYPMDGYQLKGKFSVDLLAKGLYSKEKKKFPLVDSKLTLTDGSVQYKGYPHPIKDIHFFAEAVSKTGDLADARLTISKLTYTLEDEPFTISGSLTDLNKYEYSFKIDGKADLSKISQVYPLDGIDLSGIIDARIRAKGLLSDLEAGNYTKVATHGKMKFSGVNISGSKIPTIKIDSAVFKFNPDKIVLQKLEGKLGKSNIKLQGDIFNYMAFATQRKDLVKGDLDFQCDTLDINEWMPPARTASGKTIVETDSTHSKLTVIEVPKNFEFVFDSEIKELKYDDLKISDLDGEITLKDGVMSLHETGFNSLNAKFSVTGDYDTKDMLHPKFDILLDIKELDINKAYREIGLIRKLAPSVANTYGSFSINYKLKGELSKDMQPKLETLVGGGTMRIADAKIKGMKLFEEISKSAKKSEMNDPHLKDFTMETEIKDSKIIVKPFSIKVSGFDADIEGVNTMSGMINYLVKIELIPFTKIKVPFHVTGHYNNPKVAIGKGHTLPY